jgi:hypothetical protein
MAQSPTARVQTYKTFLRDYGWILVGTSMTWFCLDVAFYSQVRVARARCGAGGCRCRQQNLFQSDVFTKIGWVPAASTMDAVTECYNLARAQVTRAALRSAKSLCLTSPLAGPDCTVLHHSWLLDDGGHRGQVRSLEDSDDG